MLKEKMMENNNLYLIDQFTNAVKDKKLDLLQKIIAQKDEKTLQFLVGCLGDEYWPVRKAAADGIREYGENAIPILSAALNSYNHDVQHWAIQILGDLGINGFPSILRATKSANDEIRFFACAAIGNSRVPQGVTPLLRALGDPKWRVRKSASDALIKYGEPVIAPLQQILKITKDEDIRFWTIKTLGKLGPKAQKFLLEALRTGDKQTRYVIAAALGESGDKRVIRVLIESLADPDWTIRKSATMALAEIGDNAIDMMFEYLRGPNEEIRDGCLRALVKAGNESLQKLFDEIVNMDENHRYLVRRSLVKIGARVVEPLMRLFKLENPDILAFAASALGEIGNPRAVPVLVTGLSSNDWNVRRSCAYALTEIGERGVEKIAEALKSSNDDVRYWVTRILETIGEPGVPYLVNALRDPNREIRFFSAKALGSSFDPGVAKPLIHALADEVWSVRKAAAESLCKMDNLPIEEVMRFISSDNEDIRYWINHVIKEIGHKFAGRIVEAMRRGDSELRLFACQAAGIIESEPHLVDALISSLRDESEWVRIYAAIALGKTGDERSIIPLIRCFSDRNTEVHRNVVAAFKKLGEKVYVQLIKCIDSEDPDLRKNSALALAEMQDKRGLDHIIMLLEDNDTSVRATAAESLGSFPCAKARAVLAHALGDSEIRVRKAAIKSIAALGTEEDALALMIYSQKIKEESEIKTVHRMLGEMSLCNPDLFIEMFKNEQSAIKNMAYEALVTAGMEVLARLTQVAAESKDENQVHWCKKTIKQIKMPKESMFYV